jgi:hypothetical protein
MAVQGLASQTDAAWDRNTNTKTWTSIKIFLMEKKHLLVN